MKQTVKDKRFGQGPASHSMRLIKSAHFQKGHPNNPQEIQLIYDYYCGITPVTQTLWDAIMKGNPSSFSSLECPVEMVSWLDAILFCNRLSKEEHLEEVYQLPSNFERALTYQRSPSSSDLDHLAALVTQDMSKNGYRLPTEAEWEYAARGSEDRTTPFEMQPNATFRYSGSDTPETVAWFKENADGHCCPVAKKEPNLLGLYDMSGNVHEWCWDWESTRTSYQRLNPCGPKKGQRKILRGGSFRNKADDASIFSHRAGDPSSRKKYGGFRIVRTVPPPPRK